MDRDAPRPRPEVLAKSRLTLIDGQNNEPEVMRASLTA
jgi:hypothetical protein